MLSSVLKSKAAVAMNIAIVRVFIVLRRVATEYKEIMEILDDLRKNYDGQFDKVYRALEALINQAAKPRRRIGFRRKGETEL